MGARAYLVGAAGGVAVFWLTACSRLVSVCVNESCGPGDAGWVTERPDGDEQADAAARENDSTDTNIDAGSSDAGSSDAGSSDAGSSDAGSSDAGSSDAGSSDAGSSDAGSSDAGSSDAGSSDAGSSDADPGCELALTVHHEGAAHDDILIDVTVPFFGSLVPEASNLRFRDVDGAALPFWIEEVDATAVYAYVRLPVLATGATAVIASACPLPDEAGSDLMATFPWVALPGPELDGFTPGCTNFDIPATERCVVTLSTSAPESAELLAQGSCYGPTYNGSMTFLTANLPPLVGTYRLDMQRAATGQHDDFCQGSTETRWQLSVDGVVVEGERCALANCNSCAVGLSTSRSEFFTLTASSEELRIEAIAGDCSWQTLSFTALRLVPVLDPPPWVTFD